MPTYKVTCIYIAMHIQVRDRASNCTLIKQDQVTSYTRHG